MTDDKDGRIVRFRRGVVPLLVGPDELQVRTGLWAGINFELRDPQRRARLGRFASLLDGTRSVDEICEGLDESEQAAFRAFAAELERRGALRKEPRAEEALQLSDEEAAAYGHTLNFYENKFGDAVGIFTKLQTKSVAVVGAGVAGTRMALALADAGVGRVVVHDAERIDARDVALNTVFRKEDVGRSRPEVLCQAVAGRSPRTRAEAVATDLLQDDADLGVLSGFDLIVLAHDVPSPRFTRRLNEFAIRNKVPWTTIQLMGLDGVAGPTVIPGESACHECRELRLISNTAVPKEYQRYREALPANHARYDRRLLGLPSFVDTLVGFIIADVPDLLIKRNGYSVGRSIVVDFYNMTVEMERVLKLPRCPACGRETRHTAGGQAFETISSMLQRDGVTLYAQR